jgi:hypothetical protein
MTLPLIAAAEIVLVLQVDMVPLSSAAATVVFQFLGLTLAKFMSLIRLSSFSSVFISFTTFNEDLTVV